MPPWLLGDLADDGEAEAGAALAGGRDGGRGLALAGAEEAVEDPVARRRRRCPGLRRGRRSRPSRCGCRPRGPARCRRGPAGPRWRAGCRPPAAAPTRRRRRSGRATGVVRRAARGRPRAAAYSSAASPAIAARSTSASTKAGDDRRAVASRSSTSRVIRWSRGSTIAVAWARSSGVVSSCASTASTLAWMTASGLRSSCEASSTSWRCADERRVEPAEHVVDGVGQVAQLVVRAVERDPPGQVGGGDLLRGRGDPPYRPQRPAGQPPADAEADQEQRAEPADRVVPQRLQRLVVHRGLTLDSSAAWITWPGLTWSSPCASL